jgi:hypothetical protein
MVAAPEVKPGVFGPSTKTGRVAPMPKMRTADRTKIVLLIR